MSFKKVKVVMLPTNEKAKVGMINLEPFNREGHELELIRYVTNGDGLNPQHLYFLSDEEIKEDDWVCNGTEIWQVKSYYGFQPITKKIIATTDKSLITDKGNAHYPYGIPLPQPSQSFIEKFVEEYNKGNVITEVMVEYEVDYGYMEVKSYLKVNLKDNTITIRKIKDSWSREEVIQLLKKLAEDIDKNYRPYTRDNSIGFDMVNNDSKWIKENL